MQKSIFTPVIIVYVAVSSFEKKKVMKIKKIKK